MSNLTTLPKGDSAWLLRKSIQRIMQQVSVLETNIGSSTTGNSADTQVIFNDNGTLRGDTGLTYDKSADRLSFGAGICYGLLTSASATITGDLTLTGGTANGVPYLNASKVVTTSDKLSFAQTGGVFSTTFNINSLLGAANYKGGIVVTEDDNSFTLYGGSGYKLIDTFGYATPNQLRFYASNAEQYRIGASGVFNWYDGAGGTRMTLNSTGLGVGVSPNTKLAVTHSDVVGTLYPIITAQYAAGTYGGMYAVRDGAGDQRGLAWQTYKAGTGLVESLRLSSDGNVGIGVVPSAWAAAFKVLQVGSGPSISTNGNASRFDISTNYYYDGANKFLTASGFATSISQENGNFYFLKSSTTSGGIGSALTFNSPMTLDASGNLLVGTTSQNGSWNTKLTISNDSGTTKWAVGPYLGGVTNFLISAGASAGVYLNGTAATSWTSASDERLKDIIEPISNAVSKVASLRAVIGKFKFDENNTRKPFLIAQDIQAVLPEAVDASNPDKLGVAYTDVIPLIVAAIKELTARVQTLEAK